MRHPPALERRLRLCHPDAGTVKSSLELTVGSSSKEMPTVTRGRPPVRLADFHSRGHRGHPLPGEARKKRGSQGSLSSPSADGRFFHRALILAARESSDYLVSGAARTRIAGKAAGPESGPALPRRTPMSARPFAVGGRLAVPSVYIAAEPGRVGQTSGLSKLGF
jgi:hypothetical protein